MNEVLNEIIKRMASEIIYDSCYEDNSNDFIGGLDEGVFRCLQIVKEYLND